MGDPKKEELWSGGGLSVNPLTPDIHSQELGKERKTGKMADWCEWGLEKYLQIECGVWFTNFRHSLLSLTVLEPDVSMSLVAGSTLTGFRTVFLFFVGVSFRTARSNGRQPVPADPKLKQEPSHRQHGVVGVGWTRIVHLASVEDSSGFCASALTIKLDFCLRWESDENFFVSATQYTLIVRNREIKLGIMTCYGGVKCNQVVDVTMGLIHGPRFMCLSINFTNDWSTWSGRQIRKGVWFIRRFHGGYRPNSVYRASTKLIGDFIACLCKSFYTVHTGWSVLTFMIEYDSSLFPILLCCFPPLSTLSHVNAGFRSNIKPCCLLMVNDPSWSKLLPSHSQ